MCGTGRMTVANGKIYDGIWENSIFIRGVTKWPDGKQYKGPALSLPDTQLDDKSDDDTEHEA
jgi:hypothetical protein